MAEIGVAIRAAVIAAQEIRAEIKAEIAEETKVDRVVVVVDVRLGLSEGSEPGRSFGNESPYQAEQAWFDCAGPRDIEKDIEERRRGIGRRQPRRYTEIEPVCQ